MKKLKPSHILASVCRVLFPFILIFGFYIIIHGHLSPGGGFQGGAILATAFLTTYFMNFKKITDLNFLIKIEKIFFLIILLIAMFSLITKGEVFTSFLSTNSELKPIFLITLNFFIGIKVASGLISIIATFIEEGRN
ncbi:MAG: sodium:proton antiporter [Firmicutes bacterium]|nr:sodium:proton antiporter [Bacillota bacterium]